MNFIAEWELRLTPEAFLNEFTSWPRAFFEGARELLRELRTTYRIGCLSNSNPLHWEKFRDIEEDFDMVLMSHLLGAVKPDHEIFLRALHQCKVDPSKVYFFDDCYANVGTAQSLGIKAFHVDGNAAGSETTYNIGIYSGCIPSLEKPGEPITTGFGTYRPEIYKYYKSHTKSETALPGIEIRADKRGTILNNWYIRYVAPLTLLAGIWGAWYTYHFFFGKEEPKPETVITQPTTPDQSGPIRTNPDQSGPIRTNPDQS